MNQDDIIYVPLTTSQKRLFGVNYICCFARVNPFGFRCVGGDWNFIRVVPGKKSRRLTTNRSFKI